MTTYTPKDFTHLLGMKGFSDIMLNNHFTLYNGYVNNVNVILGKMNAIRLERLSGDESHKEETAEMHRRYGWEYNGIKLHELYFENLTRDNTESLKKIINTDGTINTDSKLAVGIIERYDSFDNFKIHFIKSVAMFRGIGWVALIKRGEGLGVIWIGEHDQGLLANAKILLIMDMWEHAYMTDYGIKKAEYIEAFWNNIDWNVVENRLSN